MAQEFVCKSCKMPMRKEEDFCINADGSKNKECCVHCCKKGACKDKEAKKGCGGCCGKK